MVKSFSAGVSSSRQFLWPVGVTLASVEIFRAARRKAPTPHPEERPLGRVSKDGPQHLSHGSRRRFAAPHHEDLPRLRLLAARRAPELLCKPPSTERAQGM